MRVILITIISALLVSACASVTKDFYFAPQKGLTGWEYNFEEGNDSSKSSGYSDKYNFIYEIEGFSLALSISYQNYVATGPLILPVLPTPEIQKKNLEFVVIVKSNNSYQLDPNKWQISNSGDKQTYFPINVSQGDIKSDEKYYRVGYTLEMSKAENITINFGEVQSKQKTVVMPILKLHKVEGKLRYEQFTL